MLGIYGFFLIIAPIMGYPLDSSQAFQLLQVIFPLFVGYLMSAAVYIFQEEDVNLDLQAPSLLEYLVKGPFVVVFVLMALSFLAYGVTNWPLEERGYTGDGMSFETLANLVTVFLAIHTGVTSTLVIHLFKKREK